MVNPDIPSKMYKMSLMILKSPTILLLGLEDRLHTAGDTFFLRSLNGTPYRNPGFQSMIEHGIEDVRN